MKFKVPTFATPYIAKTVVLAGRFLPINIVTGVGLLMATAMGDVANVRRLCKKVRPSDLPLSLQHAILNESIANILLLDKWEHKKGVNRPQQQEALETFDGVSSVVWDITPEDTRQFLNQLVHGEHFIPQSVDVGSVAVKLCTRQNWPAEHKRVAFSALCHQVETSLMGKYGESDEHIPVWAIGEIYDAWKFDLSAEALVPVFSRNPFVKNSIKNLPHTLLENCVVGAPDRVLIDMVNNSVSQQVLNSCSKIFDRPNLSEDLLYVFLKKGMDVRTVLEKKYGYRKPNATMADLENELADSSSQAFDTLKNVQLQVASENQKAVLVEAVEEIAHVETTPSVAYRRKM